MNFITQNKNNKCASVALCNLYVYYFGQISEALEKNIIKNCSILYNSNVFFDELEKACDILGLKAKVIKYTNSIKMQASLEKFCSKQKNILMILVSHNNIAHSFLVIDYNSNTFVTVGLFPENEAIQTILKDKFFKMLDRMKKQEPFMIIKLRRIV